MQALDGPAKETLPAIRPSQAIDFRQLSGETVISLRSGDRDYLITPQDVIRWIAPGAPLSEAAKLLVAAQRLDLDPMTQEIELLEIKGKWSIYVRKSGLMKNALRNPDYDGHESGLVIVDIEERTLPRDIPGTIVPAGFKMVGGWAKFYRKGISRPIYKRIALQDYDRGTGLWKVNPAVMTEKVALAQGSREAYAMGEVYDESELPGVPVEREARVSRPDPLPVSAAPSPSLGRPAPGPEPEPEVIDTTATVEVSFESDGNPTLPKGEPTPTVPEIPGFDLIATDPESLPPHEQPCTQEQQDEILRLVKLANMSNALYARMLAKRGVASIDQLTRFQATQIASKLGEHAGAKEWQPLGPTNS